MAARLPFAPGRSGAPVAGARLPARPVAQRAGRAPEEAARHGEELGAPRHEQPARVRRDLHERTGAAAMKLAPNPVLDALCGEYLVGTLRGVARRRFERALREEPLVAARLEYWQGVVAPRYTKMMEAQPRAAIWNRLERELGLSRYRAPWHKRAGFWRGWAVAATAALVLVVGLEFA